MRQRQNRTSTRALLPTVAQAATNVVPPLPERERKAERWHPEVVAWWTEVWQSPMASEFLGPDVRGGLYLIAELYQRRWTAEDTKQLVAVAAEIRNASRDFGLTPMDRRRLQWEVEKGEQAAERTQTRRQRKQASGKDPREVLRIAK